jgi:hypothetical protein
MTALVLHRERLAWVIVRSLMCPACRRHPWRWPFCAVHWWLWKDEGGPEI